MSNLDVCAPEECRYKKTHGSLALIIEPRVKDLGGFSVRRLLPVKQKRRVGPWIFFDHMGPAEFPPGEGINVRPHPHINLATVTYVFEGEILHRDSLGSSQVIVPGDINLMVAGKGIVHSERSRPEIQASGQRLHALQLWLALPEANEEMEPEFLHYPGSEIPLTNVDGVSVRVMMGSAYGISSPVKTFARTFYAEANLKSGQSLIAPREEELAVYVTKGTLSVNGVELTQYAMAVLKAEADTALKAETDTRVVMIGGEPLSERYLEWNFVSSRQERIEKAKRDWQAGRFPKVPGDEKEFIPLPE